MHVLCKTQYLALQGKEIRSRFAEARDGKAVYIVSQTARSYVVVLDQHCTTPRLYTNWKHFDPLMDDRPIPRPLLWALLPCIAKEWVYPLHQLSWNRNQNERGNDVTRSNLLKIFIFSIT